MLETMITGLWV